MENNFDVMEVDGGSPVYLWRKGVAIEDAAIQQLRNLATIPFVHKHIAAMPDTHFGIGATVGSVFGSIGAVIPAAVGVDIGCGMIAARTNLLHSQLNAEHLKTIRAEIERLVPMGRTNDGGKGDRGAWAEVPDDVRAAWDSELATEFAAILERFPEFQKSNNLHHLGSLGTGNHFIEVQFDEQGCIWIMLHSGSRGIGNRIGQFFIQQAKKLMEQYFIVLPDKDLAYLPEGTQGYTDYIRGLHWAQKFAFVNRQIMLQRTLTAIRSQFPDATLAEEINTHHNYAAFEQHFGKKVLLTRKGAINAETGKLGIIPGSMGTRSYIVRGLGNRLSFNSCSHGAGRAMSRTEAKKRYTVADHEAATAGVECRKDAEVIDETPMAYKDIDAVIEAERDLVEVVHTMKQMLCCKG